MRPLVVLVDTVVAPGPEREILAPVADLQFLATTTEADLVRRFPEVEIILIFDMPLTERAIAELPKCRAIVRCGVGTDNVDLKAAGRRGIVVCNVPDYGTEEVADHAILLLLAAARRLVPLEQAMRAGKWDPLIATGAPRLRGKTLGLIGCGRIGTAMALRAKALGLRVAIYDPYKPDGYEKAIGVERCSDLEDLLPQAQFLSLHCPLTPETRHIINARTLALLPRGAYLVNTGRGPCVDQVALLAALENGQIAYAGLDVVEREPLDNESLRRHPRVVLTPHSAFYSVDGYIEMRSKGAEEARRILQGEPVRNLVNLQFLTNPRCAIPAQA